MARKLEYMWAMQTQTIAKIKKWPMHILNRVSRIRIIRLFNSQSSALGHPSSRTSGECAACNHYQIKEKKR